MGERYNNSLLRCYGEVASRWSADRFAVYGPHDGGLGMPDLETHWLAEKLAFQCRSLMGETV